MEKRHLVKPAIIYGVVWFACLALYWGPSRRALSAAGASWAT